MGLKIVTGRTGEPHVTSRQMQAVYRSFLGDFALLDVGAHLAATATSNDNVRISDGVVAVQGIYAVIAYNEYDDNYIEPVSVGMKRIDTLILHYTKSNDIEDMQIEVVEGEEVVDNPVAPTIAEGGDAWEGTADIKVPIYDVLVTSFGLTVTPYSRMNTLIPTLDSIAERIPESIVTGVKGDSETLYRNGNVNITKDNIGLGNVDNTADTNKPVSNATQTALNLKADLAYVDAKIAAAYHAGGSKTVAELTSALLIADNMGKVYNMSDSGTTTSDFVEGAGEPINEGDNVGICNVGTEESPIYKFDLLSGFVDLSAYATTSALNAGLAEKVDKVAGKGLSTNDYTTADKNKLAGIEAEANKTIVDSAMSDSSTNPLQNKVITAELAGTTTATGNPITIESSESNLVECTAEVEAVQEGSGDPSPDNIRPITGQTEVAIEDVGKNLFDKSTILEGYRIGDGGNAVAESGTWMSDYIYVKALIGKSIVANVDSTIAFYSKDKSFIERTSLYTVGKIIPQNAYYLRAQNTDAELNTYQIELGSTPTTYEPYKGKTYTIQFGDTYYGGTLDVSSGELVVDRGYIEFDGSSDENWFVSSNRFASDILSPVGRSDVEKAVSIKCNMYKCESMSQIYANRNISGYTGVGVGGDTIYLVDNVLFASKDVSAWKTYLASNPLQVVYELATPYTIQLTPQQIRLLKGTNNISCNTGDLTIKYYPDNVLGQLKGDIEKGLNAYYEYQIQALWDKIGELQA